MVINIDSDSDENDNDNDNDNVNDNDTICFVCFSDHLGTPPEETTTAKQIYPFFAFLNIFPFCSGESPPEVVRAASSHRDISHSIIEGGGQYIYIYIFFFNILCQSFFLL